MYDMSHTITCSLVTQTPSGNISISNYPHSEHEIEHLLMAGVDRDDSIGGWRCESGYQYWIEKTQPNTEHNR